MADGLTLHACPGHTPGSMMLEVAGKGESAVPLRQAQVAVLPGDTIRVGERYF